MTLPVFLFIGLPTTYIFNKTFLITKKARRSLPRKAATFLKCLQYDEERFCNILQLYLPRMVPIFRFHIEPIT